ncbi:MAG: hypothetical protein U5J64_04195 [Halobacteriales archaeon]|nr:hypothetical protein [Halobacteriales archaeon]
MSTDSNAFDVETSTMLVVVLAVSLVGFAVSGVVVADVLDPGAQSPDDGPVLSDWNPQSVNSSTVDRYQVTIRANNTDDGITLIRQRRRIQSSVTQKIIMNSSFGPAMNPEIVASEGDGGPLGDSSDPERIGSHIFVNGNGDVVVNLNDTARRSMDRITAITVEFDSLSAPEPGFYNFTVEMQAQDTRGTLVQTFDTLSETGVAQVEVVGDCVNRRDLSRGQEDLECPFDRDISRGGSREELDRNTGRGGGGEHPDSDTSRRNRGR